MVTETARPGHSRGMLAGTAAPTFQVTAGPVVSFDSLYDAHFDVVWRTLARLGVPSMNLDDATQEVFITAWRRQNDFQHRSSLKTWLIGITIRVAADARKSLARKGQGESLDALRGQQAGGAPDAAVEAREGMARLRRVLSELTDEQREVFVLMEMEGYTAPEVSDLLHVALNTVYSRLRLARAAFNAAVAKVTEVRS